MTVLNRISRFHLVINALNNSRTTLPGADELLRWCFDELARHAAYVREHMEDLPEIREWRVAAGR